MSADLPQPIPWPATLLIALAAAAHQGWSANLFSTPDRHVPLDRHLHRRRHRGGRQGPLGGAAFTWIVKRNLSLHPLLVFSMAAASAYLSLARLSFNCWFRALAFARNETERDLSLHFAASSTYASSQTN